MQWYVIRKTICVDGGERQRVGALEMGDICQRLGSPEIGYWPGLVDSTHKPNDLRKNA